jgi:pseudouridylate synthase
VDLGGVMVELPCHTALPRVAARAGLPGRAADDMLASSREAILVDVPIRIAAPVADALAAGRPVVALESTLICHGLPRPRNAVVAAAMEAAVVEEGAVSALVAVQDGLLRVGLSAPERDRLAADTGAMKCSIRELPLAMATGRAGGTTVAATLFAADRAGISVMATGGIGGVHRGDGYDESADLVALARHPVAVVCSGIKAVLDLPRTLERLETLAVPVLGMGCDDLPAFYGRTSGLPVPAVPDLDTLARIVLAHRALGLRAGLVVANPPPQEHALPGDRLAAMIGQALAAAREAGVRGAAQTPFLLDWLARHSAGATVALNEALVLANARLAARLARHLARAQSENA